jgi:hypothetical protein
MNLMATEDARVENPRNQLPYLKIVTAISLLSPETIYHLEDIKE